MVEMICYRFQDFQRRMVGTDGFALEHLRPVLIKNGVSEQKLRNALAMRYVKGRSV